MTLAFSLQSEEEEEEEEDRGGGGGDHAATAALAPVHRIPVPLTTTSGCWGVEEASHGEGRRHTFSAT